MGVETGRNLRRRPLASRGQRAEVLAEDIVAALEAMGDDTLRPDDDALANGSGGTLADILEDARRDTGMALSDLTVLSDAHDPYRVTSLRKRRDAKWFAEQWAGSSAPHLRGFHYKLIGRVTKPDGSTLLRLLQGL